MSASDGRRLSVTVLEAALEDREPDDVEMGIILTSVFGITDDHLDPLCRLATAEWHHKHEDVARLLGEISSPASVPALVELATWTPEYLLWDEGRALAVKAVRALGKVSGNEAQDALAEIASVAPEVIREVALKQLARR